MITQLTIHHNISHTS